MKHITKKTISSLSHAGLSVTLLVLLFGTVTSCHLASSPLPSTIVIAVDQLGMNQIHCANEEDLGPAKSGIALLCQESVRFTHAYTTSLQSGAALTSVLTAQYPFQNGMRGNAKSFLSSKAVTLAEVAQLQQVATGFFSGGAPVLRKTNLQQGFEIFDDHFTPSLSRLHRPFSKLQKIFENWLQDIHGRSFLAFFYVPDLALINTPTQTDRGEARNLSFESQAEEFDETLWHFIQALKDRKIWDSTTVILVGLNGPDSQKRVDELFNTNLYSERTQIGLLVKPSQKPRDQGLSWSFDGNVSLADLGKTLLENYHGSLSTDPNWPVVSLNPILKSPSAHNTLERPLLIESFWNELSTPRTAVRWGQYLFLLDEKPRAFNSLIDKLETAPIRVSDGNIQGTWEKIQSFQNQYQLAAWPDVPPETRIKWKSLSEFSSSPNAENAEKTVTFERLAHRLHDDSEINLLYSRELLILQNWEDLQRWSQGVKNPDLEKIADKNLKKENRRTFRDPCLAALEIQQPEISDLKKCLDPLALPLLEWAIAERGENSDVGQKEALKKRFLRQYVLSSLDQKICQTNWALQGSWDLSPALRQASLTAEMMLALPEMQKLKQQAVKAVQQSQTDISEL